MKLNLKPYLFSTRKLHLPEERPPFKVEFVFADDIRDTVFDVVNPETELGWYTGFTLEQLQSNGYPTARLISFAEWLEKRGLKREDYT